MRFGSHSRIIVSDYSCEHYSPGQGGMELLPTYSILPSIKMNA
jgi:hypothetical protein